MRQRLYNRDVAPPSPARRPRRTWLRRALWTLLLMGIVLGAGMYYVTRPQRLSAIVVAVIEHVAPVTAQADAAHISMTGRLTIEGLRLGIPTQVDAPEGTDQLFDAEQVVILPRLRDLVRGRLMAESITLIGPTVHLIEDLQTGRFNIQNLATDDDDGEIPQTLPQVVIRDGHIRFSEVDNERLTLLGGLRLDGRLIESRDQRGEYVLLVRQTERPSAAGETNPVLRGTLRLAPTFKATAILEHFSIEAPHRNLLPRRLREWWDQLSPQGSLPTVEVSYDADPQVGLQAVIALEHGALSLPYGDFAPRMTEVSGRFVAYGDTIDIEHLTGKVAGIHYAIDGVIHGFEADAGFDLTARTEPFTVAQNPYYLSFLPPQIRKHYLRFNPSGRFSAMLNLHRADRGGDLRYRGELTVLDGRGAYHKFPFPLQNVHGVIRFSEQKVEVVDLRGNGPGGGELVISGIIAPPGNGAAVDMHIVARDVPVDRHLLGAMQDKHRKVVDVFLNQDRYRQLVQQGLVRSSDPTMQALAPADATDAPTFNLGGVMSAVVEIARPFGDDADYRVTTTIDTTGAGMLCKPWPYPLVSAGGSLIIGPDAVVIHQVQARGLSGGSGIVHGIIERPAKDDLIPVIELQHVRLPIDELLLESLPDPQDQWVRDLGVTGEIVGHGRVFEDDSGEIDFALKAEFVDATADPFRARVEDSTVHATHSPTRLHELEGAFTVSRAHLELDRIQGRSEDTSLSLSGDLDWAADPIDINLRLSAAGLDLGPNLLAMLPTDHAARTAVNSLLDRYRPNSRFAGELNYRSRTTTGAEDFTLTLKPDDLAFDWYGHRVSFDALEGTAVVRPGEVEIRGLTAAMEHGQASVTGRIPFGQRQTEHPWVLRISAAGDGFDDNARALIPQGVRTVIDGLEVTGHYDMTGSLVGHVDQSIRFDGHIALTHTTANVGLPIDDLRGHLTVTAVHSQDQRWPYVDLRLEASTLRAADRLIEPLTLHLVSEDQPQVLAIREMTGGIYRGHLIGRGAFHLDPPGRYLLDFTLNHVDLVPFIDPLVPAAPAETAAATDARGGTLTASLAIQGVPDQPHTRSGRGALEVVDAELFDKPLTMAILHATNLSLPTHRAFDRASARYLVDGDTILFDTLRLESPAVAIIGTGTMDYPTRQLDLALVARNPGAPSLGAINDLLNVFKDELLAIQVTGSLDAPRARLMPFEGFRNSWERIFTAPPIRRTPIDGERGPRP